MARRKKVTSWRSLTFIFLLLCTGYLLGMYSLRRNVSIYPPIPRSVDVIVIGGETAGAVAALAAAEDGSDVLYIDVSEPDSGGFPAFSPAFWAAETPYQRAEEVDYAAETMAFDIYERGGENGHFNQILHFAESTATSLSWLEELTQTQFSQLVQGNNLGLHLPVEGDASEFVVTSVQERLQSYGVETISTLRPERLLIESQQVYGLQVQNSEEQIEVIYTQAIILADGGFGGNMSLLEQFAGVSQVNPRPGGAHQGMGLNLATEAGARTQNLNRVTLLPMYLPQARRVLREDFPGAIFITDAGREAKLGETISESIELAGGSLYVVYGEENGDNNRNFAAVETLTELAGVIGVQETALENVTAELTSPFYVAHLGNVALTPGGVMVDEQYRVLDEDGTILGLYAAGEITAGLHGRRAIVDLFFSETITAARIAGMQSAQWASR